MQTVDEILAQEPPSPAFTIWYEAALAMRPFGANQLRSYLAECRGELIAILGMAERGNDGILRSMRETGTSIQSFHDVRAWIDSVTEALGREPA
jgi:hypothetical protein